MLRIRTFRPSDSQALIRITRACFEHASVDAEVERRFGRPAGRDWKWRKCRHIRADIAATNGMILVAEDDGRVAGYITTRLDREGSVGFIANLAVDPSQQRRGIARRLLHAALDGFREEGMELARIETLAHNEAGQALYPSVGFQEVARQIYYAMPLQP